MSRSLLLATAVAVFLLPGPADAARGPSTAAERKRAVETTRRLEKAPLARSANEDRRWLLQWIEEIPDIQVNGCSGPLDPLLREDLPNGRILYLQSLFGITTYLIENPKRAEDWVAVQTAGIESVLRAYESIVREERGARVRVLDGLLSARKERRLTEVVEMSMSGCGNEEGPAPEDAI